MKQKICLYLSLLFFISTSSSAQQPVDTSVKEIVIVFKTHFDIGYTDFAEAVVQKYSTSMMENAFDIIERNKYRAPEKQFVWTVSGWPMSQMLNQRLPATRSKVEGALVKGRFVIHALPFSMETESSDPEMLVRGLNISSGISRKYGLPLPYDAKMSDVPSHSWILATLLTQAGVKILHIGCNSASSSPEVPVLFWWEGPDGSKLMTMYSEKYYGTSLLPPPNWPYKSWLAIMQTNDNSGPPTPENVDNILREVHQNAPNAKVKIGRISDFYDAIIKENPQLPVVRGDMPDTWIHGFMSMPREVKDSRRVSKDLFALESLNTLYNLWSTKGYDISGLLSNAYTNNLLFDEHTFGMAMSHGNNGTWCYGDEFKMQRAKGAFDDIEKSWKEKADRVFAAEKVVTPSLNRQLRELAGDVNIKGKRIFVYNPLPWKRSGVVTIKESSSWNLGTAVKDIETGEIIPVSNEKNLIQFVANDIPPSGYHNYILVNEALSPVEGEFLVNKSAKSIENKYLKIQFDPAKGVISSIVEKSSGKEMVDAKSEYGFGQYLYERFSKEDAGNYVKTYVKASHEWADDELGRPNLTEGPHVTAKGRGAKIIFSKTPVSVSATLLFGASTDLPHSYSITVSLYKNRPNLELIWNINSKPAESWPEAGWISLPFRVNNPTFKLARLGAVVDPARDFIKGSNFDYCFLNSGMCVIDNTGNGFGLSTPDAPGVSLDRPGLWKYSRYFIPQKPNVFVNLYNNIWSTNFTEWIEGSWSVKISLWFTDHFNNEKSIITPSEEFRSPLLSVLADDNGGNLPASAAGVQLSQKGVLITAFGKNPDGDGTILRLWEQAGISGKLRVTLPKDMKVAKAIPVNLRGEINGNPINIIAGKFEFNLNAYTPASFVLQ
ncbi:glycoside hydrolase family 38 N-terminal domain-containing protein [Flavitalea flava]